MSTVMQERRPSDANRSGRSGFGGRIEAKLNPVLVRDLRQLVRLKRTPLLLCGITILVTVFTCALGALASVSRDPEWVGIWLYQVFFSAVLVLVTWCGPAVAALLMVSELQGTRWEVVKVSGIDSRVVARGKYLSAVCHVGLAIIMVSPVGALSLLFGGVTVSEILMTLALTFATLIVVAGFGVCVGSVARTPQTALLFTVPLGALASMLAFVAGLQTSSLAAAEWPVVSPGVPLWLPTVLARGEVTRTYILSLIALPGFLTLFSLWFFYELTVANLAESSEDASTGLRRWFLTASLTLYTFLAFAMTTPLLSPRDAFVIDVLAVSLFAGFGLYLFAGDAKVPSERVQFAWRRRNATLWTRFLGPGVAKANVAVVLTACYGLALALSVDSVLEARQPEQSSEIEGYALVGVAGHLATFLTFLAGFTAYLRTRSVSGSAPRMLLSLVTLMILVGPWLVAGITALTGWFPEQNVFLIAVPSPLHLVGLIYPLGNSPEEQHRLLLSSALVGLAWLSGGVSLFWAARDRVRGARGQRA